MSTNLTEANYALNNLPTKKSLITTVLSWRLFDLFNKYQAKLSEFKTNNNFNTIASFLESENETEIKCGFSIKANVSGATINVGEILDDKQEMKVGDIVYHHTSGTHKNPTTIPLSTKQHTSLHNEIKKLYSEEILKNNEISLIYNDFVKEHKKTLTGGYNAFGSRIRAFEVTLVRIAIAILDLLVDDTRDKIYAQALKNMQAQNIIPIDIMDKAKKEKQKQTKELEQKSIAEEFNLYNIMWEGIA